MALLDIWKSSRKELEGKILQQVLTLAGDGKLGDGNAASTEFREFLAYIPSEFLERYSDQCLSDKFDGKGFALQDLINEVGNRLGFEVVPGRYRGTPQDIGFDGLWKMPSGHSLVVEIKTTDAYRINLDTLAAYRRRLIEASRALEEASSVLIVVGRKDTGDLEAQIRGSQHAWSMRLISIDALIRLMHLKEKMEDPDMVRRVHSILVPREFTKLDEMVEVVFSAAEGSEENVIVPEEAKPGKKFKPVSFHEACATKVEKSLNTTLVRRSRGTFSAPDNSISVLCLVSKEYARGAKKGYWFAFHPHQKEMLEQSKKGFIALGCGSDDNILLVPVGKFIQWLPEFNMTEKKDRYYWHVLIGRQGNKFLLHRKQGASKIDLKEYVLG